MTDTSSTGVLSLEERRDLLVKALRKYRSEGYAVDLSADGLTATLSRRTRVNPWIVLILTLFTIIGGIIYFALKTTNRKTETVVLRVDERGKVIRA